MNYASLYSICALVGLLELVSATCMYVSFNILVSRNLFNTENMKMMEMLSISHRHNGCIESDMITSV